MTPKERTGWANDRAVERLRKRTGCSQIMAVLALELREGLEEFAVEYLQNRDLPVAQDEADRYPKWFQYLQQRRKL